METHSDIPLSDRDDPNQTISEISAGQIDCVNKGTVQAYVAYTIKTQKPGGVLSIAIRRYGDFEWLQAALEEEFKDVLIPPIPSKDALGRFTKGVVQYRRREFNRFLKRVVQHPKLSASKHVHAFLNFTEAEFAKHVTPEKTATEKTSTFFSSVFEATSSLITKITVDAVEIDPWFTTQDQYIDDLVRDFGALQARTNANTKVKSENIQTLRELSDACCSMEKFEGISKQNSTSLYFGKLSEVTQSIAELDVTVVKNETEMFEDSVTDHQRLSVGAKRILNNRKDLLSQYYQAVAEAAKLAGDPEAKNRETEKKDQLDSVSKEVKSQIESFRQNKSHEMRWALRELVRENIEYGEQMLALWKEMDRQLDKTELI